MAVPVRVLRTVRVLAREAVADPVTAVREPVKEPVRAGATEPVGVRAAAVTVPVREAVAVHAHPARVYVLTPARVDVQLRAVVVPDARIHVAQHARRIA